MINHPDYDNEDGAQIIQAYIGVAIFICVASVIAAVIIAIGNGAPWSMIAGGGIIVSALVVLAGVWKERRHRHWRNEQHENRRTLVVKNDNYINRQQVGIRRDDLALKEDQWENKLDQQARREMIAAPVVPARRELVQTAPGRMELNQVQPSAQMPVGVPKKETLLVFAALLELGRQPTFQNCVRYGMPNNTTEYKIAKDYLAAKEWVTASEAGETTEWAEAIDAGDVLKENAERLRALARRDGR